jgi:V-type H+-transporting ATPase subunit d
MADTNLQRQIQDSQPAERSTASLEGLATFAFNYSFQEAYVRGLRSTFLNQTDYKQLQSVDSIEDFRTVLQDTDYITAMQGVTNPRPQTIYAKAYEKWVKEFEFLKLQATGKFAAFLDLLSHEYLIANVVSLIAATVKGTSPEDVLSHCHPLGNSPYLQSMFAFEKEESLMDLYRTVLVDMPIGKYFGKYFDAEVKSGDPQRALQGAFKEVDMVVISDQLRKLWLEELWDYSQSLGGATWETMKPMLEFEADRRAVEIVYNSIQIKSSYSEPQQRQARQELFCSFGKLFPVCTAHDVGSFINVDSIAALQQAVEYVPEYAQALRSAVEGQSTLSDALKSVEVRVLIDGCAGQAHFGVLYSFSKLKAIELENIRSLANTAALKRSNKQPGKYVPLF